MNLRDLQYLVAVAEHRHFRKAAEACFVSQPTLSSQIRKLEETLGATLIERTRRKVFLTEIGEAVVERARSVLQEVRHIQEIADIARNPLACRLQVGIIPTLAPYLLPHVLPAIREACPSLELLLHEGKTHEILEQLRSAALDAVILALPIEDHGLESRELFTETFFVAAPPEHPLDTGKPLRERDLRDAPIMLLAEGHCLREQALSLCKQAPASGNGLHATSLETLRHMVGAGMGVTLAPALSTLPGLSGNERIRFLAFEPPAPSRRIAMSWRKSTVKRTALLRTAELIEETIAAILPEAPAPAGKKPSRRRKDK